MENKIKLYQKLHEIQCAVDKFVKDETAGQGSYAYDYTSGSQVLSVIRPLMNQHKLLLKPEVLSIKNKRQDYSTRSGEKSEMLTTVEMKFTWIDTETGATEEVLWGANGQNDFEKGLGSALTYGERYFLIKFFHVPTDELDPDKTGKRNASPQSKHKVTKWLSEEGFKRVLSSSAEDIQKTLDMYNKQPQENGEVYGMKTVYQNQLIDQIKKLKSKK